MKIIERSLIVASAIAILRAIYKNINQFVDCQISTNIHQVLENSMNMFARYRLKTMLFHAGQEPGNLPLLY